MSLDTGSLDHSTHSAAGDHAGTGSSGLEQHAAGTERADDLVRDRRALQGHGGQVLLSVLQALADRFGDFGCFAEAEAHTSLCRHPRRRVRRTLRRGRP